ncbi:hypothetical protein LCGC14_2536170 [marine sediment metagenome]|uniref:Uncharacterized protein n=1 Tax=marine sediment metagenome TaxID=412755 RepID=A0A0F9BF12_9ZZZZ
MKDIELSDSFECHEYISPKKFEQWKIDSLQLSKVFSIQELKELLKLTEDLIAESSPEPRSCYYTASECALHSQDVNFVLGYATIGYIINDHAWNSFNGIEFDLMKQINIQYQNYYKIIEFSKQELLDYLISGGELKDYPLLDYYYKHKIATANDYISGFEDVGISLNEVIKKLIRKNRS